MVFQNNFVVAVKCGGKILRESQSLVTLPFGSEYSIILKNLNSRRAMVKVSVDGTDATEGTRLILPPNGSMELERFIRNNNLSNGNRFKFIERTAGIEAHRGITENDGLIRAEFWAERQLSETVETVIRRRYVDDWYPVPRPYPVPYPKPYPRPEPWWESPTCSVRSSRPNFAPQSRPGLQARGSMPRTPSRSLGAKGQKLGGFQKSNASLDWSDTGITVPGSESRQQFQNVSGFQLETNSHIIVLQLRGAVAGKAVTAPVTVSHKPTCATCGKANKTQDKFCRACGTALELI